MKRLSAGFSLLEVGVVMVVVGLVAGGILTGQELGRRSELNAAITDAATYAMAVESFGKKYAALPGDISNATQFWGRADLPSSGGANTTSSAVAINCTNPAETRSDGKPTCNGDGDGVVESGGEDFRAWQHLYASDYLTTKFTGIVASPTGAGDAIPGENVPSGKRKNTGYSFFSAGYVAAGVSSDYFEGSYDNAFVYGAVKASDITRNPALKPKEAREIDEKIDDKYPATGDVRTVRAAINDGVSCTRVMSSAPGTYLHVYDETVKDTACILIFTNTFKRQRQN